MRVGFGVDVHRFCAGDKVVLGGVIIPHTHALEAHSDGDVLLHALCDALLGAAGLGDIGAHFPDTDARYKNVNSRELLRLVIAKLSAVDLVPYNVSIVVVAQAPKLSPYIPSMRASIAEDMKLESSYVNVAATTSEYLGFTGRKEGIAAFATVTILSSESTKSSKPATANFA